MFSFEVCVCMNRKGCGTGWGSVGTLEVWQGSVCWASGWTEALSFERLLFLAPKVISYLFSMLIFLNLELFYIIFLWWKFYNFDVLSMKWGHYNKNWNGWHSKCHWAIRSCFKNSWITNSVLRWFVALEIWFSEFGHALIMDGSFATEKFQINVITRYGC